MLSLSDKAKEIRRQVLEMCIASGKGHIGSALSCVDILVALYYGGVMNYDPKIPAWQNRDRFILSKGHASVALYAVLADCGFFPKHHLTQFCKEGSIYEGHPNIQIKGIEANTGSLGHGLNIGCGIALANRLDGRKSKTIVLISDGECYEGSTWEAAIFAAHHRLTNLTLIIDRNGLSATDFTEQYNKLEPLKAKWEAFGWEAKRINGHSISQLVHNLSNHRYQHQPRVLIAETVKGKGISFMENNPKWHHGKLTQEEVEQARSELAD